MTMTLPLLPGAVQVRIQHANTNSVCSSILKASGSKASLEETVQSWSVPAWVLPVTSPNVQQGLGEDTPHATVLHARLAQAMGIQEGDSILLEFAEMPGQSFVLPVSVKATVPTAILIHGALSMGMIVSFFSDEKGEALVFKNGRILRTVFQSFWAGLRVEPPRRARAVLEFHGAKGYGFCVRLTDKFGQIIQSDNALLLEGYGYTPTMSNIAKSLSKDQMDYTGLLEGLWWAMRLHIHTLWVRGDAHIIINQCHGTYPVQDEMLQEYHNQVLMGLEQAEKRGITCIVEHAPRESNQLAISLANFGTELKQCATIVNWANCNRL